MNPLFSINIDVLFLIIVIASMVAMFSTEVMAVVPMLTGYKKPEVRESLLKYVVPVWEVVGTFFVLWLVDMENVIPEFMPAISYTLFPLFAVFIFFLLMRNSIIIYAEFVWHDNKYFDEKKLYYIYSISTFIMGLMALSILAAVTSGYGTHVNLINYSSSYTNYAVFYSEPAVYGLIIGSLILFNGISLIFYRISDIKTVKGRILPLILTVIGLIIDSVSYTVLSSGDKVVNGGLIIIPVVLTLIIPVLYMFRQTTYIASYKPFVIILFIISITFLELMTYPYVYGFSNMKIYIPFVITNSAMQHLNFIISVIGGIWLILMMIYYGYVSNNRIAKLIPETEKKPAKETKKTN